MPAYALPPDDFRGQCVAETKTLLIHHHGARNSKDLEDELRALVSVAKPRYEGLTLHAPAPPAAL